MPLQIPSLDDRKYQDLLDEALARIPVHNPEWKNFNKSDPGVTLIELFAFLTENLLYRSNQIPERNRRKFLTLLGIGLQPATSAQGIVTITNERGPLQTVTLNAGLEVRSGQVPFRTERSLDILPLEAQVYYKHKLDSPSQALRDFYERLYISFKGVAPELADLQLYETLPLSPRGTSEVDLAKDTVDGSLWIALLLRPADKGRQEEVREALAGKTLSLGIVPALSNASRQLIPGGQANPESAPVLLYQIPKGGSLPTEPALRIPRYETLPASPLSDILAGPGVVEITLPAEAQKLILWDNIDPLEAGVGDFPPALEDPNTEERLITWLRLSLPPSQRQQQDGQASLQVRLLWVGINATRVTQQTQVVNELLPPGSGEPDQVVTLSKTPIIPGSVCLMVTTGEGNGAKTEEWQEIDDLLCAGPEVPVPDLRQPPGTPVVNQPQAKVFTVNAEAGEIRFGDGLRGARPPYGATLRVDYAYGVGRAGNVGAGSINTGPALLTGFTVTNPVRTWGGAEAETISEGEKQIACYLQHRERLVNASDFETITLRTPGVDIGRVNVLPAFNPALSPNEPGDAPGAVTVMVIPRYDQNQSDAPVPDRLFLDTICDYLDSRRLITTEVFLRGPTYIPIWVSVGIDAVAGTSPAEVREAVKQALKDFLSPLPRPGTPLLDTQTALLSTPQYAMMQKGWPLRKPVVALELLGVANRVPNVLLVNNVLLARDTGVATERID
ncbi:MAG: baseplate J/gp47 family protein, partial [Ktedonobacteraceae bacterium]|nr:baseplate J/gp47 family protein [Ktedonobacteraceae bacterium]